jgi:hypothetical protein
MPNHCESSARPTNEQGAIQSSPDDPSNDNKASNLNTDENFDQDAMDRMNNVRQQAQLGLAAAAGVNTVSATAFKQKYEQPYQELK